MSVHGPFSEYMQVALQSQLPPYFEGSLAACIACLRDSGAPSAVTSIFYNVSLDNNGTISLSKKFSKNRGAFTMCALCTNFGNLRANSDSNCLNN